MAYSDEPRGASSAARPWHVLVMAKSPAPGRSKTRLCPPLTPAQAAELAAAALADTLDAVAACGADRKVLALDGLPGPWIPPGIEVISQRGRTFGQRLAAAWADCDGPGLQIGMDTPQVTADLLDRCLEMAAWPGSTAALGRAPDGGWWAIALKERWNLDVFTGVPMSRPYTWAAQFQRLETVGHRVRRLPELRDVDVMADATAVAAEAPATRFASAVAHLELVGSGPGVRAS